MVKCGETVKGKRGSATRDHAVEKGKQEDWRRGTKSGGEERAMLLSRWTVQGHIKLWIIRINLLRMKMKCRRSREDVIDVEHQAEVDLDQGKGINKLGLLCSLSCR